jgi:LPXTG-motif cell wall-anchored protein
MIYTYLQGVDYYSVATTLSAEGGDEPTEDIEIDKIDVSGITAPEYGKTVADYKASFVPVLPEGANYSVVAILWFELDPETMEGNGVLADDYVFDSSKTYGFGLGIEANDGYTFADGAVITANGGALELYASMAEGPEAALALVFNPVPATGDNSTIAIFAIAAVATIGCVALALRKKKED